MIYFEALISSDKMNMMISLNVNLSFLSLSLQVVGGAVVCAATTEEETPEGVPVVVAAEAEEALGGRGVAVPRCPLLKNWMLSLTPMSTRSTSEVIGGREWRPSSSSSSS